jgi:non-ribosomal peptide synthetase component F
VRFPAELLDALHALGRREGATLYMSLLSRYALLLRAGAARTRWWSARPIAGRTRAETEGLIGFFVNTLVLRTRLSATPPSASCWRASARPRWARTPARTCRSSGWWRSSSRSAA